MKKTLLLSCLLAGTLVFAGPDKKPGKWTTLFDGKSLTGWHSYKKDRVVGWSIDNGTLVPDGTGGDLVTDKEYENFELEFEFKIPAKSNSGVIYKVIESPENATTYMSGPEFQVIDDGGYSWMENGKKMSISDKQKTGANYDMHPPTDLTAVKPAGEWNKGRIVVNNNHVEHYLNGKKVVEYHYGSDAWKAQVAQSKFAKWPYATPHAKGKIALQNHSPDEKVWYRNIRIREL